MKWVSMLDILDKKATNQITLKPHSIGHTLNASITFVSQIQTVSMRAIRDSSCAPHINTNAAASFL